MRRLLVVLIALGLMFLAFNLACDEAKDAAEDLADDDLPDILDEGDMDADTPEGWRFLFAIELNADQAESLDEDWYVPLELLGGGDDIDGQIIAAKQEQLEGYGYRLWFSTKAKVEDDRFKVDADVSLLDGAAGGHGGGIYAFYSSDYSLSFIAGEVSDCEGNAKADILVTATDSPFFTYTIAGGKWALPVWNVNVTNQGDEGNSVEVHFDDGDCYGSMAIGTALGDNGKIDAEPYAHETMGDNSDVIKPDPILMNAGVPAREPSGDNLDFELCDFTNWEAALSDSGDAYPFAQVLDASYGVFFPGGGETCYALLSTGGANRQTVTIMRTVEVPADATAFKISYDFISQEYAEWVGSGFNDVFTLKILGSPDYIIYRTINNTAEADLWEALSDPTAQAVADIDQSTDAAQNDSGKIFDGHLKANARGPRITDHAGAFADYDISPYQGQEITLVFTIADVGDKIYDSAVLIDYIKFE
ncbi:MAG: choice-of-anchor L domain-containing protein [Candidatus Alcyoniella australis]|nr:choice-of-anchor L domain-containing protein [Candidatus Alcyoniella australis]